MKKFTSKDGTQYWAKQITTPQIPGYWIVVGNRPGYKTFEAFDESFVNKKDAIEVARILSGCGNTTVSSKINPRRKS